MTYEEYKNNKKGSSTKLLFKSFMNKLFTIVIFTMLIIIISNYSPKFRNFIIDKVLNNTIDFSFVNKFMNKTELLDDDILIVREHLSNYKTKMEDIKKHIY